MIAPDCPADEANRLSALHALQLLDSGPDERFDALTRLAVRLFGVPIALVSLVDAQRQWFKACVGLGVSETARDISFCGHAILDDALFVIEDASADPRFADNPLVTSEPHIRFYAGCPLHAPDGSRVGTLCIVDTRPRRFGTDDRALLSDLGRMAEHELLGVHLTLQRDRTEATLRANQARLQEQEVALLDTVRQKDAFLATLAHELRNPLAPIRAAAHIIKLRAPPDAMVAQARDVIERQTTHLARLVDDLLDVARITQGRVVLVRRPESVVSIVADAVDAIRPAIEAAAHQFSVDLPQEALQIEADATRIAQALVNLLNNAAKYTPERGRIELTVRRVGDAVRIAVRDNGIGVAPEDAERIFGMFAQEGGTVVRRAGGLGIGLALSRKLVEMHGGSVTVSSAGRDQGSVFAIELPLLMLPTAPEVTPLAAVEPEAAPVGQSVLVVDDNLDAVQTLRLVLELEGHTVRVAHDGAGALAAVAAERPQWVLLDIGMPDIDGYEVARTLRARYGADCPTLVAVTGWGQAADRERARAAGFSHHYTKPLDPDALTALFAGRPRKAIDHFG